MSILALIVFALLFIPPYWQLWKRTGHSPLWSLLMLIPIANLVSIWVLAFKDWPASGGRDVSDRFR